MATPPSDNAAPTAQPEEKADLSSQSEVPEPASSSSQRDASHTLANGFWHSRIDSRPYTNNLLWAVGLLELSNAMDFPANVFNDVPTPLFAQILMGLGGSIAILWSMTALTDMHRSGKNISVLLTERSFMKRWQRDFDEKDTMETRRLVQAVLDVNYRELGWELIDRVLMDLCAGISGIVVGTGALMAIRGDIGGVYAASNLLSGYIGNSLLAPFALANTIWACIMWRRAGVSRSSMKSQEPDIVEGLRRHGRRHKLYASLNGLTALVGTIGSIMSSTLWYGYVLIVPCVFTSLFCNLFWRFKLGYNRSTVHDKHCVRTMNIAQLVPSALAVNKVITSQAAHQDVRWSSAQASVLASYLHEFRRGMDESVMASPPAVATRDTICPDKHIRLILRDHERYLLELYGRYLRIVQLSVIKGDEKD